MARHCARGPPLAAAYRAGTTGAKADSWGQVPSGRAESSQHEGAERGAGGAWARQLHQGPRLLRSELPQHSGKTGKQKMIFTRMSFKERPAQMGGSV